MSEEMKQPEMPAAPQEQMEAESSDLSVNDLNAMKTIIDIASSRGAFKPNEMIAVGQVYTKLTKFLSGVTKPQGA
jgi:cell division protein FtsL